jgi:hypothetical protein
LNSNAKIPKNNQITNKHKKLQLHLKQKKTQLNSATNPKTTKYKQTQDKKNFKTLTNHPIYGNLLKTIPDIKRVRP